MGELQSKKIIVTTINADDLEGNLSDVVDYINGMINDHEKSDTSMEWDEDSKSFTVSYTRMETLQEADKRIQRSREYSGIVKDRELAKLKELQEKYGGY